MTELKITAFLSRHESDESRFVRPYNSILSWWIEKWPIVFGSLSYVKLIVHIYSTNTSLYTCMSTLRKRGGRWPGKLRIDIVGKD